jgi:hypothetical protein
LVVDESKRWLIWNHFLFGSELPWVSLLAVLTQLGQGEVGLTPGAEYSCSEVRRPARKKAQNQVKGETTSGPESFRNGRKPCLHKDPEPKETEQGTRRRGLFINTGVGVCVGGRPEMPTVGVRSPLGHTARCCLGLGLRFQHNSTKQYYYYLITTTTMARKRKKKPKQANY